MFENVEIVGQLGRSTNGFGGSGRNSQNITVGFDVLGRDVARAGGSFVFYSSTIDSRVISSCSEFTCALKRAGPTSRAHAAGQSARRQRSRGKIDCTRQRTAGGDARTRRRPNAAASGTACATCVCVFSGTGNAAGDDVVRGCARKRFSVRFTFPSPVSDVDRRGPLYDRRARWSRRIPFVV